MSEKRFTIHIENMYKEDWYDYPFCIKEDGRVVLETIPLFIAKKVRDKLNEQQSTINKLKEENEQLKQQLLYDGDDVCDICKHESLIPSHNYFIGKCEKGHDECSKEDVKYCEDFELKESSEWKESDLLKTILTW